METPAKESKKIDEWLYNRFNNSRLPVLNWLAQSLKRDRNFSLGWKLRKGVHFFNGLLTAKLYLRKCTRVGKRARTYDGKPFIDNTGTMIFGDDVIINSRNVRSDFVTRPNGILEIGDHAHINFGASFVAEHHIKIGSDCHFGPYCFVFDSNTHLMQGDRFEWAPGEPVILEDNVWLASRVIVLKGSVIGEGSTIAAGSVVSGYIPPYTIAGGIPARVIKYLKTPDGIERPWVKIEKSPTISPDIKIHVNNVLSKLFDLDTNPDEDWGPLNVEGWNSFSHLSFIQALEMEFNIQFSDKDIVKMTSLKRIYKMVDSKISSKTEYLTANQTG